MLGHYHMNLGWFEIANAEWTKAIDADPKILGILPTATVVGVSLGDTPLPRGAARRP